MKKFLLCIISTIFSTVIAYKTSEMFFFDKFFYKKSVTHGYWSKNTQLEDFGNRTKDLITLKNTSRHLVSVLGISTDNRKKSYTIAVIGDSWVWGEGVKFNQTLTQKLKKRLNKVRPTRILTLAEGGDSILDYYARFDITSRVFQPDLYIFVLVSNDALINGDQRLENNDYQEISFNCQQEYPHDKLLKIDWRNPQFQNRVKTEFNNLVAQLDDQSWRNPVNLCIVNNVIKRLPNSQAIYFLAGDYTGNDRKYAVYKTFFDISGKRIMDVSEAKNMPKYSASKYWNNQVKYFHVSKADGHPSVFAHSMFADILYDEITADKEYGFIE